MGVVWGVASVTLSLAFPIATTLIWECVGVVWVWLLSPYISLAFHPMGVCGCGVGVASVTLYIPAIPPYGSVWVWCGVWLLSPYH